MDKRTKRKPSEQRPVLDRSTEEVKGSSGTFLADAATQKSEEGTVVAVGAGRLLEYGTGAAIAVSVESKEYRSDVSNIAGDYSSTSQQTSPAVHSALSADDEAVAAQLLAEMRARREQMGPDRAEIHRLEAETSALKIETERLRSESQALLAKLAPAQ